MGQDTTTLVRPVLLDNTVLTNFALVGRDDLVRRLWPGTASTTPSAMGEFQAAVVRGLVPSTAWTTLPLISVTADEAAFALELSPRLEAGERECLAVAVHRSGLLVSDDLDARNAARDPGVPTSGTLGVLVSCVRRGFLSRAQANTLLAEMIALGYRSPITSLDPLFDEP
jgi:predicted nucleic acid-binding protein